MKNKVIIPNENMLQVVSTALVMNKDTCDGKGIPMVILNTENRQDINQIIEMHHSISNGEIESQWGMTDDKKDVILMLTMNSPVKKFIGILFDADMYMGTIDRILQTNLLILQGGKNGDRAMNTINNDKMFVEIPDTGFESYWADIKYKIQKRHFKKLGVKRKELDKVITEFNSEWNSVIGKHFK